MERKPLTEFIGDEIIEKIDPKSIWLKQAILDKERCNEYDFDASFFDVNRRVEKKYNEIEGFRAVSEKTLIDLAEIVKPPTDGSRVVILGTTEYLFPYVAYCLQFIKQNNVSTESGNRDKLPFIFFSLPEYSEKENIKFIDCISDYYRTKKYIIHLVISKDKKNWVTREGNPRTTIYEMMRLFKNLGDIEVTIVDSGISNVYKVIFENKSVGGRKKRNRKKSGEKSKKRKHLNKKNRTNKTAARSHISVSRKP